MTSGKRLTERQVDSILRLVRYRQEGTWLLTYDAIAKQLDLDAKTVSECVREAAASWGRYTQWHDIPAEDCQDVH